MTDGLPTKWGTFEYDYADDKQSVRVTGGTSLGGQDYSISLTLYRSEDGWQRHQFDDLEVTKVGGEQDGKPARPRAREIILEYLPEQVNSVIGDL